MMKMKNKIASINKGIFAIAGMGISFLLVIFGILVISNVLGGDTFSPSSAPYLYDSGYATFGADSYTYMCNNTAETASAARVTAYNLEDIALLLKNVCGIFMIGFGLLNFCRFAMEELDILKSADESNSIDAPSSENIAETTAAAFDSNYNTLS